MPWIDVPKAPGAARTATARARAHAAAPEASGRGWYRFRNAADATEAELFLYDEVGGWFGATAEQFVEDLAGVTAPSLRVRVNSPGGSVFEGLAIANALRAHPANVTVQVDGLAASIASVIAMAADKVVMAPQSMLMIHEASGMCLGDSAEMAKMAEVLDVISSNIADAYAGKTGGSPDDWRAAMREETWYKAQDAVDAGLADEVMPAKKPAEPDEDEPQEMAARWDLAAYGYAGPPRPKPAPPAAKADDGPEQPPALVISIADILDEDTIARLRAAVAERGPAAAAAEFGGSVTAVTRPETIRAEAIPVHHTATEDSAWDGPAAVAAMPNDAATLRYCHAWQDSASDDGTSESEGDGDADDQKSSYKFPHHRTKGGPANLAACRNGLARLENSSIPDGDKAGVRKHLQAHLDDAAKKSDDTATVQPEAASEPAWGDALAHLTTPAADPWTTALAHLTQSATTDA